MSSLHIIYASTSGHTEYVVDTLIDFLKEKAPDLAVEKQRVELADSEDLQKGDVLILASSTWNTGGPEGQLNPHMHQFVHKTAKDVDLSGRKIAIIGLGDDRYYYTGRAADFLEKYVEERGGEQIGSTLRIINEPYDQDEKIKGWGEEFLSALA